MESLEHYRRTIKSLAANTHGQISNVRTFKGRQLLFLNQPTRLFVLPYLKSVPLQDLDPESETFGQFIFMADTDSVDSLPIQ